MTNPKVIDGKAVSQEIKNEIKKQLANWQNEGKRTACLAVVLVGDDPASQVYVGHKEKACASVGIQSRTARLRADTTQQELEHQLTNLAEDPAVDGILLQLPLPKHLQSSSALRCIPAAKDVDGLTTINQGLLASNQTGMLPCTPAGCLELIKRTGTDISGKKAVVIGRSILVGWPVATLLQQANATVTVVHSRTENPKDICRQADILVVAAGKKHMVDHSWIKDNAVVIDVGIHRTDSGLVGDVDFTSASQNAGFITPVPGGVGPMTIAMLLQNTLLAYEKTVRG